jgi:ABC-type transport system involved in cytochrome bd biosynthesis fused ATPase/permease subunit
MESFATKPAFKSNDDSITVFIKADHFLIKHKGSGKVKVYKSADTQTTITTLRNRNRLFSFSQRLFDEYKVKPNFDEQKLWTKLRSYDLDKYITLDNEKFNAKLDETRADLKKNWL